MDYVTDPAEVLSLIIDIHITDDLSDRRGNIPLPSRNYGPSGQKFRTLISDLNAMTAEGYSNHEVGIYRGRTLLTSALENPNVPHVGVDNFS